MWFGPDHPWNSSTPLPRTDREPATNQRAELYAIIEAMLILERNEVSEETPVTIYTDSTYSKNCITKWRHVWQRNGWMTYKREPVKNSDLIRTACRLYDARQPRLTIEWVKGHTGKMDGNSEADRLATLAAAAARDWGFGSTSCLPFAREGTKT